MARTLRREHRFTPSLRTAALSTLNDVMPRSGARLLAVAIMSNHLHLVVQQGDRPLKDLMQPYLRRLASMIQRAHRFDGPVFWRPYALVQCLHPAHARNAIAYVHLNPVRARLCAEPGEYPWTSHILYSTDGATLPSELRAIRGLIEPAVALPLFAAAGARTTAELRQHYRAFITWRIGVEKGGEGDEDPAPESLELAAEPPAPWSEADTILRSPLFHARVRPGPRALDARLPSAAPDIAALARETLVRDGASLTLEEIRGRRGGYEATRLRHAVIRRLAAAGFPNVRIAGVVDLSESAVSDVLCGRTGRNGPPPARA